MYLKNDRVVAHNDNAMNPDVYEVEVHCSAACTDAQIIEYVEDHAFCYAGGARIVERPGHAVVRYFA
jgi:hypothetical protein